MNFSFNTQDISLTKKITAGLSILVLVVSFTQPAFFIDRQDYDAWANSLMLFFFGWSFFLGGSTESLIWSANPIYIFSLFLYLKNNRLSAIPGAVALVMAIGFSFFDTIMTSESGETSKITSFELGYKLWILSFAILFAGAVFDAIWRFRNQALKDKI